MASKKPTPDQAEHHAYFPSDFSLAQYVPPTTDFDGAKGAPRVTTGPRTILTILTEERYLPVKGEKFLSTGNHPVETLLPLMHLMAAGYEVEVATLSGRMAKFELWAMPAKDGAVAQAWETLRPSFERPRRLADVVERLDGSDYAAVFVPGGHGATIGLPDSEEVGRVLAWALDHDRPVVTLCHGPAALLAAQGLRVANDDMTGAVHADRVLLTGDSPLASNALGRLAVETLTGARYAE